MKRNKSLDGYRNKMLQVRLTEAENAAFQILYASSFFLQMMISD